MNTGVAVSTVVGTIIVLVATLPDFGSFVHNRKHALIAAGVTFLVAYPLLYWAGATPSAISGQGSLLGAMAVFGAVLPAALLLIFACVTGNAGNMFEGHAGGFHTAYPLSQMADYRGAGYPFRHRRQYGYYGVVYSVSAVPRVSPRHPLPEFISLTFSFIAVMAIKSQC